MSLGCTCVLVVLLSVFLSAGGASALERPLYVHLALTHEPSSIYASWFTLGQTRGSPVVRYGTSKGNYPNTSTNGTTTTYHPEAGYCHDALLEGLAQGVTYYYVCGNDVDGWSQEYHFNLRRVLTKPTKKFPMIVPIYGDMGITNSSYTIKALEKMSNVDFFYHVGDISYADDRNSDVYEKVWNQWFEDMSNIMPYTPYMVLPGNHEHSSGREVLEYSKRFAVFRYRFSMPPGSGTGKNMWYSFDYQNVHFVSISTETDYPGCEFDAVFGNQLAWLEADLKEASHPDNRTKRPWIIVSGHKPLYSSLDDGYVRKYLAPFQKSFEEMFHRYKVDIFFCGHIHAYERTYPVYHDQRVSTSYHNPDAIVTVTTGAAGDVEGLARNFYKDPASWSAVRYGFNTGYGVLRVYGDHELKWTFHRSFDSHLVDTFTLTK